MANLLIHAKAFIAWPSTLVRMDGLCQSHDLSKLGAKGTSLGRMYRSWDKRTTAFDLH